MLNNLDLFKVRLIGELVRSESLARAGRELGITSSAISQNIRSLERSLGKPLFIRVGKSMKPTPLALEITELSRPFFANLSLLLEDSQERVAELKIAAPPIFGATDLLDRLEKVQRKYSSVRVALTLLDTHRILEDLLNGRVDFGFIDDGPHMKSVRELVTTPFLEESLMMCCSVDFRKMHLSKGASLKELRSLPHIPYHHEKEGVAKWYLHHYRRVPDFPWTFAVDNPYGVLRAVMNGQGLGVVPRSLIAENKKKVSIIAGPKTDLKSKILLAQNKSRVPSRLEKAVLSLLLQR